MSDDLGHVDHTRSQYLRCLVPCAVDSSAEDTSHMGIFEHDPIGHIDLHPFRGQPEKHGSAPWSQGFEALFKRGWCAGHFEEYVCSSSISLSHDLRGDILIRGIKEYIRTHFLGKVQPVVHNV